MSGNSSNDPGQVLAMRDRRQFLQASLAAPLAIAALTSVAGAAESSPAERSVYVNHAFPEHVADLGEVKLNYAVAGSPKSPPLLLIPGQSESWWGYEKAMTLLAPDFYVHAVDLRGQGRSSWTPSRYTLDNMGNDLVKFIALVIKRPVVVSGNSSGGVLSAWLAAFSMPGQIRGALLEDPPLFASELSPLYGQSIRQGLGPMLALLHDYLGDQWSIGDWQGLKAAADHTGSRFFKLPPEPTQNLKEYDPEWARAFWEGTAAKNCPHEKMLAQIKAPVLLTHHFRQIDAETGSLMGALSDLQAQKTKEIIQKAGAMFDYQSFPDAAHPMHNVDPPRFVNALKGWATKLPG